MLHPLMSHVFSSGVLLATVLDQVLCQSAASHVVSHGPHIVGRDDSYVIKTITTCPSIGHPDDTPLRAVPVFDQVLLLVLTVVVKSHCPDVVGRDSCQGVGQAAICTDIRTRDDSPSRAIPVHGERAIIVALIRGGTHSPNVCRRDGCHTVKKVVIRSNVRAGDYVPLRPVPVFDQCLEHAIVINSTPHRPDIIRGNSSCLCLKVECRPGVGAWNDTPLCAIPV